MAGPLRFSVKEREEEAQSPPASPPPSSSAGLASEQEDAGDGAAEVDAIHGGGGPEEPAGIPQEVDWKADDEFRKFMSNPSIEAAVKLEKKRTDRKLKELDRQPEGNPISSLFRNAARGRLAMEKERLEKAEEAFKALDLSEVSGLGFPHPLPLSLLRASSCNEKLRQIWGFFCSGYS